MDASIPGDGQEELYSHRKSSSAPSSFNDLSLGILMLWQMTEAARRIHQLQCGEAHEKNETWRNAATGITSETSGKPTGY
jgi:hypothetical protein